MRFLKISYLFPSYLSQITKTNPGFYSLSYNQQRQYMERDAFWWEGSWKTYLPHFGIEADELISNFPAMLRKWAVERLGRKGKSLSSREAVLYYAQEYRPDVIWLHHLSNDLLRELRRIDSVKLICSWAGVPHADHEFYRQCDLIFSCAPETVAYINKKGGNAIWVPHWYDPRIEAYMQKKDDDKQEDRCIFAGSFIPSQAARNDQEDVYGNRQKLLEELARQNMISLYLNLPKTVAPDKYTYVAGRIINKLNQPAQKKVNTAYKILQLPVVRRLQNTGKYKHKPLSPDLRRVMNPPLFGLDLYQVLRDAPCVLNIQAKSPVTMSEKQLPYASNKRLFEVTGVGGCLITDEGNGLDRLFERDNEIVTYKTVSEAASKVKELVNNYSEQRRIAQNGRRRCLSEHTFEHRLPGIVELLKSRLT